MSIFLINRKINLVKNIILSNFRRLTSPYKVTFALTYRCNLKCKICNIWRHGLQQEININEIEKIFKNMSSLSWIDLTGGEITLREEIVEIIKLIITASKKICIFHISTNGQLPERAVLLVKEILKSKLTPIVNISIDGPEQINDELRGVEGAYCKSLETFERLKEFKNGHYYLSCTISNYNIGYMDDLISSLKKNIRDFQYSDLHFNIFHKSIHYYNNEFMDGRSNLRLETVKKYLCYCQKGNFIKRFLEKEYIEGLARHWYKNNSALLCKALDATCFIDPYGVVFPCNFYSEAIGRLKDYNYNINTLWNDRNCHRIRKRVEDKHCPACWSPCEAYPAILGALCKNPRRNAER